MAQMTDEMNVRPIEIVDQPDEADPDRRLALVLMLLVTLVSAVVTFLVVRRLLQRSAD